MDELLKGRGGKLTMITYDAAGNPADSGGGDGTAIVKDSAGAQVGGTLPATRTAAGTYEVAIPNTYTTLDLFDVTWTFPDASTAPSEFEIVGQHLFTVAEFRALRPEMESATDYPTAAIIAKRAEVAEVFEHRRVTNLSFRPRGRREFLDGSGTREMLVRSHEIRTLVAAKIGGVAFDAGQLADVKVFRWGKFRRDTGGIWALGDQNVELFYEHGLKVVPPSVKNAGIRLCRHLLTRSPIEDDDRATAVISELGSYRLSIAGRDGTTGLPEIDAVLKRWSRRSPGAIA